MKKLIIFAHHYTNNLIEKRFNLLKRLNPSWDVISVGFARNKKVLLNNSIYINTNKYPKNESVSQARLGSHPEWTMCDIFLYEMFQQFSDYDKYFLLEYDTIFNCDIESFFSNINNYNHFGSNVYNDLIDENWIFYYLYKKYNKHALPIENCASIGQTTCIYMNNSIIRKVTSEIMANMYLYEEMNSELRLGTLIKKINGNLLDSRPDINEYITWDINRINVDFSKNKFFYHPNKI